MKRTKRRALDVRERHVRLTLTAVLGADIVQHDDNSKQRMYDLRVGPEDSPIAAIEVTQDVDPKYMATLGGLDDHDGGNVAAPALICSWIVLVNAGLRMRKVAVDAPEHLAVLEAAGVERVDGNMVSDRLAARRDR